MKIQDSCAPSHVREVSTSDCLELLGSRRLGRIGFADPAGQKVLPVNYVMVDGCVYVATSPFGSIARHAIGTAVAFEVDEVDELMESGWSVMVCGRASLVDNDELPSAKRPRSWAEGTRSLILKITADEVTGKRLIPA